MERRGAKHVRIKQKTGDKSMMIKQEEKMSWKEQYWYSEGKKEEEYMESEDKKGVLKRIDGTERRGKVRVKPLCKNTDVLSLQRFPLLGVNVPHLNWGSWNRLSLSQQLLPFIFCQYKWTAHRFPYAWFLWMGLQLCPISCEVQSFDFP